MGSEHNTMIITTNKAEEEENEEEEEWTKNEIAHDLTGILMQTKRKNSSEAAASKDLT